jgi:DnaJ domain
VSRARGGTLGDLLTRSPDAEIASVVHGLALLGVLDVLPAAEPSRVPSLNASDADTASLDEEALRARIRARLELVDEGDYFSVLGVSRDATSYEVRRAFVELRRAFEPTRILASPRLHDLSDDVRKIVLVLEEAYEILRDVSRRERYRRAIDARPG